jgi:LacI family transcriptional regulator
VSLATVSLVLNGKQLDRIPAATRTRVAEAASALGYRANTAARALRSRQANALVFAASIDQNRPFLSEMLLGAAAEAASRGQALILFAGDDRGGLEEAGKLIDTRRADGLILQPTAPANDLRLRGLPNRVVVVQDRTDPDPGGVKALLLDAAPGRAALMQLLASLGHRTIAYLGPVRHSGHRLGGYRRGLVEAGITQTPDLVLSTELSIDAAATAAERILCVTPVPTAVVCANDVLAAGVYQAADRRGLRIPEDLSVGAFAGFAIATALQPQLTAVATPAEEAGRWSVRLLLDLLAGAEPESAVLPYPLAVRGSTAPPR